jgi:hypothetical protein|nr:MAG TPA: hypothetical protein [Caudoviricetes sp.]
MFKYINMPTLVAHYLREFCWRSDETPSLLYRFVYSLCLPFVSPYFRRARMIALAIAECTNSADQIVRVLGKITGATVSIMSLYDELMIAYDKTEDAVLYFAYDATDEQPLVAYTIVQNEGVIYIVPNGVDKNEIEAYLKLLTPFYIKYEIRYVDDTNESLRKANLKNRRKL